MTAKYKNKKTVLGEVEFDSKREAERWFALKLLERAGKIQNLRRQVSFELVPAQRIGGRCVERACNYVADFVYEENGELVVEDSKGVKTKDYVIKRKLMLYKYGIRVRES